MIQNKIENSQEELYDLIHKRIERVDDRNDLVIKIKSHEKTILKAVLEKLKKYELQCGVSDASDYLKRELEHLINEE